MADDFYSWKGFASFGALTSNAPNVVAPLGELSLRGKTFAKDRAMFFGATDTSPPSSIELTVFSSRNAEGEEESSGIEVIDLVTRVANWVYAQALDGLLTSDEAAFAALFDAEFGAETNQLTVGTMVTNSAIWMPGVITFFIDTAVLFGGTPPVGMENARVRLWFADATFQQQYDQYDITFISPLGDELALDDFFDAPSQVVNYLSARPLPELTAKIDAAADGSPYTIVVSHDFKYYHLGNPIAKTSAYWTFVIWSDFGNNLDLMKIALAEWILANSSHSREEWVEIFPDIFATTEFVVTPLWNQYAIPNITLDHAMYSPQVSFNEALAIGKKLSAGVGYTEAHITDNLVYLGLAYKSLAAIAVGGPDNRNDKFKLYEHIPDFLDLATANTDFNRMSQKTRDWAIKMFAMLKVAETMTEFSDIPVGMYRLKRLNADNVEILYVAGNVNEVQYLVTAKQSLNALFPPVDRTTSPLTLSPDPSVVITLPAGSKHLQLNVSVAGGTEPYHFEAASTDIVAGGTIDPDTGALDVTFTDFGTNTVDITVSDANEFAITRTYTVISAPDE